MTTSARGVDLRLKYQKFLTKLVEVFGARTANPRPESRNTTIFRQFEDFPNRDMNPVDNLLPISQKPFQLFQSSPRYGMLSNLLLQDDCVSLKVILISKICGRINDQVPNFVFQRSFQLTSKLIQAI